MIVRASVAGCALLAEKPTSSPLADYAGRDITLSAVVPSQIPGLLNGKGWMKIDNLIIGGGKTITKHSVAHVDTYNKNLTHSNLESLLDASGEGAATSTKSYAIFAGGTILNYDRTAKITAYDNDLTRSAPTVLSQARNALAAASIGEYALFAGGQYDRSRIDYSSSEKCPVHCGRCL